MSRPKTIGLAIVARLEEIEELTGKVFYYQTRTVEDEFNRRMGRARGKAVIVRLIKAPNLATDRRSVRFGGSFTVSLFASPTLTAKDAKDSDELIQEIAEKLQGWWPEEVASNGMSYCNCGDITFPDDPDFEVSVLPVSAPSKSS